MDTKTEKQLWANHLERCLVAGGGLSGEAVNTLVERFEATASKAQDHEQVFRSILDQFGNISVDVACASVREQIQRALEEANTHTVDCNPISRLRTAIRRFNRNVDKCAVEVTGIDESQLLEHQKTALLIARQQRQAIKVKVPECAREKTYTALAKTQGKVARITLDVKY